MSPFSHLLILLATPTFAMLLPRRTAFITSSGILSSAFTISDNNNNQRLTKSTTSSGIKSSSSVSTDTQSTIIYQPLSINVDGVQVPIATWRSPTSSDGTIKGSSNNNNISYEHRISVSKIGKLLAGWKLPAFVDRNFSLQPTMKNVQEVSGSFASDNISAPVIFLAHGYLGSRYDLSHLGEALASKGFFVISPEYPESLAASYDATESTSGIPIDRTIITNEVIKKLTTEWNIQPKSYGIIGHSLGCGTVDRTGDSSWTRVCIAGGAPSLRGSNCLFIGSVNDGAVSISNAVVALQQNRFIPLDEKTVKSGKWGKLPARASLLFGDRSSAPNHISFLAEGPNDAMVQFLSPLLPVARFVGIPVLDFDKYQTSRDSKATGEVYIPLVVEYMKQMMI